MAKRTYIVIGIILAIIVGMFLFTNISKTSAYTTLDNIEDEIEIYKSSSCGCCSLYVNYFQAKGNSDAKSENVDIDSIKARYGIPASMESCHTTIIGDYFIEGHVPLEAVEKLLAEKPDIKGIAMPGMPSGSPGMPGNKRGDFVIYSINKDGSTKEFMRL